MLETIMNYVVIVMGSGFWVAVVVGDVKDARRARVRIPRDRRTLIKIRS